MLLSLSLSLSLSLCLSLPLFSLPSLRSCPFRSPCHFRRPSLPLAFSLGRSRFVPLSPSLNVLVICRSARVIAGPSLKFESGLPRGAKHCCPAGRKRSRAAVARRAEEMGLVATAWRLIRSHDCRTVMYKVQMKFISEFRGLGFRV